MAGPSIDAVSHPYEDKEKAARQSWRTPQVLRELLFKEFAITLDVAADCMNTLTPAFFTETDDGLYQCWTMKHSRVYCNPGFGRLKLWTSKAVEEIRAKPWATILVMATVAPSTEWWRQYALQAAEIRMFSPRVEFDPPPGITSSTNSRENCLLIYHGLPRADRPVNIWTWRWLEEGQKKEGDGG